MQANRYTLRELLGEKQIKGFSVPNWQRQFEWETTDKGLGEIQQFWYDLDRCWQRKRPVNSVAFCARTFAIFCGPDQILKRRVVRRNPGRKLTEWIPDSGAVVILSIV